MSIIRTEQKRVNTSDETDIDIAATELLDLWEFVIESHQIDEATRFHCGIHHEYATFSQRHTRRFEHKVYQECLGQIFQDVARKLGMNWHAVERLFYRNPMSSFRLIQCSFPRFWEWMRYPVRSGTSNICWSSLIFSGTV